MLRRGSHAARMPHVLLGYRVGQGGRMPSLDGAVLAALNGPVAAVPELDTAARTMLARAPADPGSPLLVTSDGAVIGNPAIAGTKRGRGRKGGATQSLRFRVHPKHSAPL